MLIAPLARRARPLILPLILTSAWVAAPLHRGLAADAGAPAATTAAPSAKPAAVPGAPVQLQALDAYLFDAKTGTVGRANVAIEPKARHIPTALLDARTGNAETGPSHATLVVLGVAGGFVAAKAGAVSVALTATSAGRTLLQQVVKLPTDAGKAQPGDLFQVPFVVQDTGCAQVRLLATLRFVGKAAGKDAVTRLERVLPFHCGG